MKWDVGLKLYIRGIIIYGLRGAVNKLSNSVSVKAPGRIFLNNSGDTR